MFLILLMAPYLLIAVMNWGGELDDMRESHIRYEVAMRIGLTPELSPEERERLFEEEVQEEYRRQGLDRPFVIRNFRHMWWAITLDLGRAHDMISDTFSRQARAIVAERVSPTALLLGVAMLTLLAVSVPVGLLLSFLSRRRGRFLDRMGTRLAPISAVPIWFYGLLLPLIFLSHVRGLPWGMAIGAILLGAVFASIYSWRTFFVGHSSDEQVEPAAGSGSCKGALDRPSFLRPTAPRMITHVLILTASVLTGSIVLEALLGWPGLGRLLYQAILLNDTPVVLGTLVIYGYVLAFVAVIVFLLDFLDVRLMQRRGRVAAQGGV